MNIKASTRLRRRVFKGSPASPGLALGVAKILRSQEPSVHRREIALTQVPAEIEHFRNAIERARKDILNAKKQLSKAVGKYESQIFDAHLLFLSDPEIIEQVEIDIQKQQMNADYAFNQQIKVIIERFMGLKDRFFRERVNDIREVSNRVLDILQSNQRINSFEEIQIPSIVCTEELSTYSLSQINKKNTLGFITQMGGQTSHAAILAKSLQIPMVASIDMSLWDVSEGDMLIIDGQSGTVLVHPTSKDIQDYERQRETYSINEKKLFTFRALEPRTLDGKYIEISANIELPVEVDKVLEYGGSAIGLYRSEFLYLTRKHLPMELDQFQAYKFIAERMLPGNVVVRTFDSGGDKMVPHLNIANETNPFLGYRSLRVCLDQQDLFKTQLRAIVRAHACHSNISVMFPMVSTIEEFLSAKEILKQVVVELRAEGFIDTVKLKVGCMIEVPSATFISDRLAQEADFFSIGTNDLVQFTLAVDRGNSKVASLFIPHHPAVLQMIAQTIKSAKKHKIPVSVCGEMASDPYCAALLIGMGVHELSMTPGRLLIMKKWIRNLRYKDLTELWKKIRPLQSAQEVFLELEKNLKPLSKALDIHS